MTSLSSKPILNKKFFTQRTPTITLKKRTVALTDGEICKSLLFLHIFGQKYKAACCVHILHMITSVSWTNFTLISVYGERENTENVTKAKIFGLDECDVDHRHCQQTLSTGRTYRCGALSAAKQEPQTAPVKLAVAGFDLHCVMKGKTIDRAGALLTPASSKHYYPVSAENFVPPEDYTAINLSPDHIQDDQLSPLTDEELSKNGSKIKVEVDMGYALQPSLHLLLTSPSVFSRLCVILKDLKLACNIIAEVFKVNSANLGPIIPLTDYQSAMASDYNVTKLYYNQRNESAANGLSLSRDRMSMSYLSTELSLQESLILVDTTPITGFAIDGVDKALKKLKQLLETREMKEASQGHMFPTVNELLSFDLEFGVPTICSYETEN
ncbi:uncharacterized protein LOC126284156 [Schistocerca gregaria]|uniref:uncharacterized protein LOC126284156 n=1 Tax=Schistocerca gregaria TaxID=7010 RepID=UPI00211E0198|nr:uncharacterized protein LOC126284156 [Schistocerca gregaria]